MTFIFHYCRFAAQYVYIFSFSLPVSEYRVVAPLIYMARLCFYIILYGSKNIVSFMTG